LRLSAKSGDSTRRLRFRAPGLSVEGRQLILGSTAVGVPRATAKKES
jgi:hypothetical protein